MSKDQPFVYKIMHFHKNSTIKYCRFFQTARFVTIWTKPRENPADLKFHFSDPRENPADMNLEIFNMFDPRENPADLNLETFEKSDSRENPAKLPQIWI